ncbi:MAG: hypothetical protein LBU29_02040, partial [Endomicrobium sp.]|nr:hypothetical protein [Endomicrobium sp.]
MRLIERVVNSKIRYLMILCLVCMVVVGLSKGAWSEFEMSFRPSKKIRCGGKYTVKSTCGELKNLKNFIDQEPKISRRNGYANRTINAITLLVGEDISHQETCRVKILHGFIAVLEEACNDESFVKEAQKAGVNVRAFVKEAQKARERREAARERREAARAKREEARAKREEGAGELSNYEGTETEIESEIESEIETKALTEGGTEIVTGGCDITTEVPADNVVPIEEVPNIDQEVVVVNDDEPLEVDMEASGPPKDGWLAKEEVPNVDQEVMVVDDDEPLEVDTEASGSPKDGWLAKEEVQNVDQEGVIVDDDEPESLETEIGANEPQVEGWFAKIYKTCNYMYDRVGSGIKRIGSGLISNGTAFTSWLHSPKGGASNGDEKEVSEKSDKIEAMNAALSTDADVRGQAEWSLGFVGNMIRSVGSVSYGEEVFREMVRMVKEEEEKGEKWK